MSNLVGTWDLVESENFDEFLKELGVNFVTRKAVTVLKPTVVISNDGSKWCIKTLSTFKNAEVNFEDGVEFEETTVDGRHSKTVLKTDGPNKLTTEQRDAVSGKLVTTAVREIVDGKLVQTFTAGNVVSKRTFKRKE